MTALSAETRELLAAVRDMLDLPYPADPDPSDRRKRAALLDVRRSLTVGTLSALVDESASANVVAAAARMLREDLARCPVNYATTDRGAGR